MKLSKISDRSTRKSKNNSKDKSKPRAQVPPEQAALQNVRELAYVQVASSELTRDINRDIVLERIRALQPVSRVDLARASGLQPSTVSSIVEQLLREKWIQEGPAVRTARGRRPTLLSLNDDLVILVADVRPSQAIVALLDLNGRFLSRQLVPLGSDAAQGVKGIASAMQRLRAEYPERTYEGVGLSLPGRVDLRSKRLLMAPNLLWEGFDISSALTAELKLRTELENAANASLLSELWFGRVDGIQNAVLVTVSEGVGTAILAEGHLISGKEGMAGEFGHLCLEPSGPVCGCGLRGCWEMFASSRAALRYFEEFEPGAGRKTFTELIGLALDGNPSAQRALERQAVAIGRGLRAINAILSPELILFAGDITTLWEMSKDVIQSELNHGLLAGKGPTLVSIGDGELARLRGAAAVVLQRHSGYYRAAHKGGRRNGADGHLS